MLKSFRICEPGSVEEACEFLAQHGLAAAVYAGGTELLLAMKEDLLAPEYLVDVKHLGLGGISFSSSGREVRIGATTTHRELEAWSASRSQWEALAEMEHGVANVRVRNQGTIGGNLCFGEPHADPGTLLSAWDASVEITDPHGRRQLPIGGFLLDEFATALAEGDVMTAVVIPPAPARSGTAYLRFGFLERPTIGVATQVALDPDGETVSQTRIAVGAVGPRPERIEPAESELVGVHSGTGEWPMAVARAASRAAETCTVAADAHGSEDYKRHLVEVFVWRALEVARARAHADAARNAGQ